MISTGFECVCVEKLKKNSENPSRLERLFLSSEIAYCNKYKEKHVHLAGILAAKLAFIKASSSFEIPLKKIEVKHDKSGKPVILSNSKKLKNYSISVSISHTKSMAVALCVISKNGKIYSSRKKKR
ncbi:MAG: 4'-phosphopantetheinyl transferase superfamily protein [bacterium]|nr:4'-phosphopantetheinyl transferase superfamily protein [bacterium]